MDARYIIPMILLGFLASQAFAQTSATQRYEAESMNLMGKAKVVGAANGSTRTVGTLPGEASGRQAVTLPGENDGVSFVSTATANAIVVRYSLPDAPGGGGQEDKLGLKIVDPSGNVLFPNSNNPASVLTVSSRYPWVYSTSSSPGDSLFNIPPTAPIPYTIKLYDEIQLHLGETIPVGSSLLIQNQTSTGNPITIDFVELETVPDPLPQPAGYLSLTKDCGVVPTATNVLGQNTENNGFNYVFSGVDDTLFAGSTFVGYVGPNPPPINPISSSGYVLEKDYYTSPEDATMNSLASSNAASLTSCVARGTGIYVPPGRYYISGAITLPNGAQIQGAGMWHSKFVAVNTGAPKAVTINGISGVQGNTGNLTFITKANGASKVSLNDFSMFGNVTQRDYLDNFKPVAINGTFTNSTFSNLWIEHYLIGPQTTGNSNAVTYDGIRVRSTFADGIDFYGATSNSTISNSEARATGDDGIAMWSQYSPQLTQASRNNTATNNTVSLNWFGHGIAVYGGIDMTVSNSTVTDTLNDACLDMGSQFNPYPVNTMTANASEMVLTRCSGNQNIAGAILAAYDNSGIPNIALNFSNIQIYSPTYSGIYIHDYNASSPDTPKIYAIFNNVSVLTSPMNSPCVTLIGALKGGAQFNSTYSCNTASALAQSCTATGTSQFTVTGTTVPAGTYCTM